MRYVTLVSLVRSGFKKMFLKLRSMFLQKTNTIKCKENKYYNLPVDGTFTTVEDLGLKGEEKGLNPKKYTGISVTKSGLLIDWDNDSVEDINNIFTLELLIKNGYASIKNL